METPIEALPFELPNNYNAEIIWKEPFEESERINNLLNEQR